MMRFGSRLLASLAILALLPDSGLAQGGSLQVSERGISASAGPDSVSGQQFRARSGQSHEVILPDGTSVVIGAGGSFRTTRFDWDGRGGQGVLQLSPGTYRISAGALGRSGDLTVLAGSTQMSIEGATAVIAVDRSNAVSIYMTVGGRVTLSTNGRCPRRLSRAGFVTAALAGECPSRATRVSGARLAQDRQILRPARRVVATKDGGKAKGSDRSAFVPASGVDGASRRDDVDRRPTVAGNDDTERPLDFINEPGRNENPGNPNMEQPTPVEIALLLAPGIDVPAPAAANVTGSTATSTDGRFATFDVPPLPSGVITENNLGDSSFTNSVLFENVAASDVFFSNSDLQPISSSLGYFSEDLQYLGLIDDLALAPGEIVSDVTVGSARINMGDVFFSLQGQVVDGQTIDLTDPTAFPDEDAVIGVEIDTVYHALPQSDREGELSSSFYPFGNGLVLSFERSNTLSGGQSNSFFADDPTDVEDAFVLYHFTEEAGGRPAPDGQSYIFATGSVTDLSNAFLDFRVERYASSFGLFDLIEGGAQPWDGYTPRRSLLPDISRQPGGIAAGPIALTDPGILFVYPAQGSDDPRGTIAQVVHADLGFAGTGGDQRSTLSIATGALNRDNGTESFGNPSFYADFALDVHSFGTVRNGTAGVGSVLVSSALRSTSAGGGNPNQIDENGQPYLGIAGYYLLETDTSESQAGHFLPMNPTASSSSFETVRFLRATGAVREDQDGTFETGGAGLLPDFEPSARNDAAVLVGFAAGLAEVQLATGTLAVSPRGAGASGQPNLAITTDPQSSRISASLSLTDPDGGATIVALGGLDGSAAPLSAYLDQSRFAARTAVRGNGLGFALASAPLVLGQPVDQGGVTVRRIAGLGSEQGAAVRDYAHVKWGVFLGDRIADAGTGLREHVHIGTWTAGDPVDPVEYVDFTGTATYTGHAIGNAFDGSSVYTAIGSFSNTWDFGNGSGSGTVDMTFDGSSYRGDTRLKPGGGFESTNLAAPNRVGSLDGEFFGGVSTVGGNRAPNALGGQFDLSNAPGTDTYRAAGTFAAEK